jgi:hypothetical protein
VRKQTHDGRGVGHDEEIRAEQAIYTIVRGIVHEDQSWVADPIWRQKVEDAAFELGERLEIDLPELTVESA